jgi:hypothetical protein
VDAVRQQQNLRVACRHPGQLASGDVKRERDVGELARWDTQHRVEQLLGRDTLAKVRQHGGV